MFTAKLTGIQEFDEALYYVEKKSAKKFARSILQRMGTVYAKAIRNQMPTTIKNSLNMASDKGIGSRTSKAKVSTITAAKVGVAVGAAMKKGDAAAAMFPKAWRKAIKHKGVGISARNLHWFAIGTEDRWTGVKWISRGKKRKHHQILTGNRVRFVGRIRQNSWGGFVERGAESAHTEAMRVAREALSEKIAEEQLAGIRGTR